MPEAHSFRFTLISSLYSFCICFGLHVIKSLSHRSCHRCTRVGDLGEGVAKIFAKIPAGGGGAVKAFRKNCQGGPLILGFIEFLLPIV